MLALLCVSSPAPEQRITRIERELAKIERSLARSEVTASETREQIMNASKAQQLMFEAKLVGQMHPGERRHSPRVGTSRSRDADKKRPRGAMGRWPKKTQAG